MEKTDNRSYKEEYKRVKIYDSSSNALELVFCKLIGQNELLLTNRDHAPGVLFSHVSYHESLQVSTARC